MRVETPIPLGTRIEPFGTLIAAGFRNGERTYVFVADNKKQLGVVPAAVIEKARVA